MKTSNSNPYVSKLLELKGANILSFDTTTQMPFNINDFIIEETIDSTSNSVVKRYRHTKVNKVVVIKQILIPQKRLDVNLDKKVDNLKKEIELLQILSGSKNVVDFYGFCIDPEHLYICLESMDISLNELYLMVHRLYVNFPEELLSKIIVKIVDALSECHAISITHRDIKPQNILVNWDGNIKLCDFGVSRILNETATYTTAGTYPYMPPEYFTTGRYGLKMDVWSLGITLIEVLHGKHLISDGCTFPEIGKVIVNLNSHELVENFPQIYSDELKEFIKQCLTNNYEIRPTLEDLKNLNLYKNEKEDDSSSFKIVIITTILHNSRLLFEKQHINNAINYCHVTEAEQIHNMKIIDDIRKAFQNLVVEDLKRNITEMKRIWGAFYGQIIGGALGIRYEFQNAEETKRQVIADKKTDLFKRPFLPMLGQRSMKPGQFNNDSEMALCLARSIVEKQKFDQIDVALSYAYWMHTGPLTAGITTTFALMNTFYAITGLTGEDMAKYIMENKDEILIPNWKVAFTEEQKQKVYEKIQTNVKNHNGQSLSNGALMRISPLAIAFRNSSPRELRRMATEDTQITHSNPIVWDASGVYVLALAALLKGRSRMEAYNEALNSAETDIVKGHLEAAKTHAIPVKLPQDITWKQPVRRHENETNPPKATNGDDKFSGYMGVALQGAFYELLHAKSFSSSLENVITRGGDTDTNGCITAALLGAYFGVDEIPHEWIKTVKKAEPYLGSGNKKRTKIDLEFFCIKDVDVLVPQLADIKIESNFKKVHSNNQPKEENIYPDKSEK